MHPTTKTSYHLGIHMIHVVVPSCLLVVAAVEMIKKNARTVATVNECTFLLDRGSGKRIGLALTNITVQNVEWMGFTICLVK